MAKKYISVKEGEETIRLTYPEAEFLKLACRDIPYLAIPKKKKRPTPLLKGNYYLK